MKVEVRLFGSLAEVAQGRVLHEEVEDSNILADLLDKLTNRYGGVFNNLTDAKSGVLLILDAEVTRDLKVPLRDGSVLTLVPAVLGG